MGVKEGPYCSSRVSRRSYSFAESWSSKFHNATLPDKFAGLLGLKSGLSGRLYIGIKKKKKKKVPRLLAMLSSNLACGFSSLSSSSCLLPLSYIG